MRAKSLSAPSVRRAGCGGGGYFYAYAPEDAQWSVLAKRPGAFDVFAYSEADDCLYGMLFDGGSEAPRARLGKVNPQGALVDTIPLGEPIVPGSLCTGPGVSPTRLAVAGRYVVILTAPGGIHDGGGLDETFIYLVDPRSGQIWLTHKEKVNR